MYLLGIARLEQLNRIRKISSMPGMDLYTHWLNPLLNECERLL